MLQNTENITNISIDLLVPNAYQPRKTFSEQSLNELANSIKEYGILNPILVRKKDEKYEIIAGERRYRAAKMIGLTEVPTIIKTMEDAKVAEVALIENLQRENITPIEEAKAYEEIIKLSHITQQKLSELIGKSQSYVANKIRLLSLPDNIQEALINKKISERHARSLMTVDDSSTQTELLERIIQEKLTVKDLDNIINEDKTNDEEIQTAINNIMKRLNFAETEEENLNKEEIKENEIKKEEKESDKMNNGNFFPNFNNTMGPNNNVSLNSMNMQSMNQNITSMQPVEETVMPTINQTPMMDYNSVASTTNQMANFVNMGSPVVTQPEMPNMMEQVPVMSEPVTEPMFNSPQMNTPQEPVVIPTQEIAPMVDTPLFVGQTNMPIYSQSEMTNSMMEPSPIMMEAPVEQYQTNEPTFEQPVTNMELPSSTNFVQDIPLFNEQNLSSIEPTQNNQFIEETPMVNPVVVEENNQFEEPQMMDTPLFSQPEPVPVMESPIESIQENNINESFYEVPVNISPVIEDTTAEENKLLKVQELLSSNGVEYKTYSNETGHCIIIEL